MQETLLASSPLLETFAGLRFLTFMVSGASCYELDDEAKVAQHGARACPRSRRPCRPKAMCGLRVVQVGGSFMILGGGRIVLGNYIVIGLFFFLVIMRGPPPSPTKAKPKAIRSRQWKE